MALASYVPQTIKHIGISNTPLSIVRYLYSNPDITVKPSVVQNRFYADSDYDVNLRRFCREMGIVYQSFWTLTGNPELLKSEIVGDVAEGVGVEREVALYGLVVGLKGICVLDGTKTEEHMKGDLEGVKKIVEFAEENEEVWDSWVSDFRKLIGDFEEEGEDELLEG